MRWSRLILAGVVLLIAPIHAHGDPCDEATTTKAMIDCTAAQLVAKEQELDELEAKIARKAGEKVAGAFKSARGAWLDFRELDCRAHMAISEGGTIAPLDYVSCKLSATEERIEQLNGTYELLQR